MIRHEKNCFKKPIQICLYTNIHKTYTIGNRFTNKNVHKEKTTNRVICVAFPTRQQTYLTPNRKVKTISFFYFYIIDLLRKTSHKSRSVWIVIFNKMYKKETCKPDK